MRLDRILRQKTHSAVRLLRRFGTTSLQSGPSPAFVELRRSLRGVLRRKTTVQLSDFDREYGVDTSGIVRIAEMDISSPNYLYAAFYKASDPAKFLRLLELLNLAWPKFHFVDIGSGKGLVLMLAAGYPFRNITGVEFAADLHSVAELNIQKFCSRRQPSSSIRSVCSDAAAFAFPEEPLLLYFYEPFELPVLTAVVDNIVVSYKKCPRPILIAYHNAPRASVLSHEREQRGDLFLRTGILQMRDWSDEVHSVYETAEAASLVRQSISHATDSLVCDR